MRTFFDKHKEPNRVVRTIELVAIIVLLIASVSAFGFGLFRTNASVVSVIDTTTVELDRDLENEECDFEEMSVCTITYTDGDASLSLDLSEEEYNDAKDQITAYGLTLEDGSTYYFDHEDVSNTELQQAYGEVMADEMMPVYNFANASFVLLLSVLVMWGFGKEFTTYEKSWFVSIMVLATIFSVLFPEESANGVNGVIIMWLYLLDTFLNILCELLISKQSRYNFLVSVFVEIVEIAIAIVLMYRFATLATTLLFWLPIDIISFINWSKHKDDEEDELTIVRRLKGWQEVLVILGIIVWTFGVGYLISGLDIATDFYNNDTLETAIIYIDACASAVGIANGLFIFFRFREQWIAWYICAALEAIINILSGQYVLLILKLGYFTNTT